MKGIEFIQLVEASNLILPKRRMHMNNDVLKKNRISDRVKNFRVNYLFYCYKKNKKINIIMFSLKFRMTFSTFEFGEL